jgi:tetratricopeptide (TPR) repeat protein
MIDYSAANNNAEQSENVASGSQRTPLESIQIDLSGIPFTEVEQDSVQKLIASYEYQLGNLFFLSLNLPDSATYYFKKAIVNPSAENVNTVSLYSLSELYSIQENDEEARLYAQRLINEYPRTEYARRVAEKYDMDLQTDDAADEVDPLKVYNRISQTDSISTAEKARRLSSFAMSNTEEKIAPKAQYEAIQAYMSAGKEEPLYQEMIAEWVDVNENWDERLSTFQAKQDSALEALDDSTITEEQREGFQTLIDSTMEKPDFKDVFPYKGGMWDSARVAVDTFLVVFNNSNFLSKVNRIKREIALPKEEKVMTPVEQPEIVAEEGPKEGYISCEEMRTELTIRGGMQAFLGQIGVNEEITIDEIRYLFRVNQRGIIDEYELLTEDVSSGLEDAFNQAIETNLNFEPILNDGQAVKVECELVFPLQ